MRLRELIVVLLLGLLSGCISTTNETVEGGTADVTKCEPLEGVLDGADFIPKSAVEEHEADGRRTSRYILYLLGAQLGCLGLDLGNARGWI